MDQRIRSNTLYFLEAIIEGEYVLAYNEATGEIDYYPVTAVWSEAHQVVVYLTLDGELIETTPEHPFHTAEGEWLTAAELTVGDQIRRADGRIGQVEALEFVLAPQPMYNLTVAEAHTYFVGQGQWLVHNTCDPPTGKRSSWGKNDKKDTTDAHGNHCVYCGKKLKDSEVTLDHVDPWDNIKQGAIYILIKILP